MSLNLYIYPKQFVHRQCLQYLPQGKRFRRTRGGGARNPGNRSQQSGSATAASTTEESEGAVTEKEESEGVTTEKEELESSDKEKEEESSGVNNDETVHESNTVSPAPSAPPRDLLSDQATNQTNQYLQSQIDQDSRKIKNELPQALK